MFLADMESGAVCSRQAGCAARWRKSVVAAEIEMLWPAGIETLSYRIQSVSKALEWQPYRM
jgi:hypothetical protein